MIKILPTLVILIISSCATIQKFATIRKPAISTGQTRLLGLDFETVDLELELIIENPNALSVTLSGFDYDLKIQNLSIVKGVQNQQLSISANGQSSVKVPIHISFSDIFKSVKSVLSADEINYQVMITLSFDLPVLGKQQLPATITGSIPVPKIPTIKIVSLKKNKIDFSGAELELQLELINPNAFAMSLKNLEYGFKLNGTNLLDGNLKQAKQIEKKASGIVSIKSKLNFLQLGTTVYNLLKGDAELKYSFDGKMNMGSNLPLLPDRVFNINQSGKIKVR